MITRITFEERNTNNYTKYGDVSIEAINKYKGILPDELLSIWQTRVMVSMKMASYS